MKSLLAMMLFIPLIGILCSAEAGASSRLSEWMHAFGPLVKTPCGHRPATCVRKAPPGAELRHATDAEAEQHGGADLALVMSNGTVDLVVVPQVCHAFMDKWLQYVGRDSNAQEKYEKVPNGWIESAGVYQMDPATRITKFSGQWTVPPAPVTPHKPETLYYFIGLEDRTQGKLTTIHQPVLTWGDESEGGKYSNMWHLWSWTCCPKNLTWHSTDIAGFEPGDSIFGTIEKVGDSTWRIDGAYRDSTGSFHNTTLTSQVGAFNYNFADVTLEVYNVTSCDQMATGSAKFSQLDLQLMDGSSWVPPTWYVSGFPNTCRTQMHVHDSKTMTISTGGDLLVNV